MSQRLKTINFYEYLIITAEDVDEWCFDRMSTNESPKAAYATR